MVFFIVSSIIIGGSESCLWIKLSNINIWQLKYFYLSKSTKFGGKKWLLNWSSCKHTIRRYFLQQGWLWRGTFLPYLSWGPTAKVQNICQIHRFSSFLLTAVCSSVNALKRTDFFFFFLILPELGELKKSIGPVTWLKVWFTSKQLMESSPSVWTEKVREWILLCLGEAPIKSVEK